jgi:hypothetical protein
MPHQFYDFPTFTRMLLADIAVRSGMRLPHQRPSAHLMAVLHAAGLPPTVQAVCLWATMDPEIWLDGQELMAVHATKLKRRPVVARTRELISA